MSLPNGFTVRLGDRVRLKDEGSVLIGGSPTRVVYLSAAAKKMILRRTLRVRDKESAALADRLLDMGLADPIIGSLGDGITRDVTVVIPVRDRPAELDRLLASIGPSQKIIVVDDCSNDASAIAKVALSRGAELLPLPANLGPSGARNAGLQLVTTPYVAFVDSDIVLEPATMTKLLWHFSDPKVAMVAPRIRGLADEEKTTWIGLYESVRSSLDLGQSPSVVRPQARVPWIPAACVIARVDALGDGFDSQMRVAEDVDLAWRLASAGWRIRYEPAVVAKHEHRVTIGEWMSRKAFYGTGADLLAKKHGHNVAPAVLAPWSVGLVLVLLAQRWWSIPVALAISTFTARRISEKLTKSAHPHGVSLWLTANGVLSVLGQVMGLLLRHWWPLTVLACLFSQRMRRATLLAALADTLIEYRLARTVLDPFRFAIARRLDDISYGTGVWVGAFRGRSLAALLPHIRTKQ